MNAADMRSRLLSYITEQIRFHLPQFDPNTADYQMVVYAYRDLESWIELNWNLNGKYLTREEFEEAMYYETEEFRVFLNIWVGRWLEKWRERVKVLSTRPKMPPSLAERYKNARRLYYRMENRKELKKKIIQKLITNGEICMCEFIAENLIIEEIARRLAIHGSNIESITLDPLDILNSLTQYVSRLPKEKGPLLYLNLKMHMS